MKIQRIHHVQLMVPRDCVNGAKEFYSSVLELPMIEKPRELSAKGGFWLGLGSSQIHVGIDDGSVSGTSRQHVAFLVDSLADWENRLESKGVALKRGVSIPGFKRFEFRDPYNNRIEFLEAV